MTYDYAIFLCGNTGAGKSTLANVLGGQFEAGFAVGEGLTKHASYCHVNIDNDSVLLIDAPGLYEASEANTQRNASEIQKALGYDVPYKIAFVVADKSGRWSAEDVSMIDKVVNVVSPPRNEKMEYVLIINKILPNDWDHYMDNNKSSLILSKLHDALRTGVMFNQLLFCPYVRNPVVDSMLKEKLMNVFRMTIQRPIVVTRDLEVSNNDLKLYEKILLGVFSPVWAPIVGICAAYSSVKNKIKYDDWEPFAY